MLHTDHYGAELSVGDAVAFPMLADGKLTLGYLRVIEMTDTELSGVDLVGQPASIPADAPYAIVRGLDEPKRRRRVQYR